jgi:hypothetical protein
MGTMLTRAEIDQSLTAHRIHGATVQNFLLWTG